MRNLNIKIPGYMGRPRVMKAPLVRPRGTMTAESKVSLLKTAFSLALLFAWIALGTFVVWIISIALLHLMLHSDLVRSGVEHSAVLRVMLATGDAMVWAVLWILLVFYLPAKILKRRKRQ
jgi:hypothetical protein